MKATMLKYTTIEEWAAKHIKGDPSKAMQEAFDEAHGVAKPEPTRRKRRTKSEMETASAETSD